MKLFHVSLIWILTLAAVTGQDSPVPENPTIETDATPTDLAIKQRLTEIFAEIDGQGEIMLSVKSGVVTLTGKVTEARDATDAETLAKNTTGVVYVRNRIERSDEVAARLNPAVDKAQDLFRLAIRKLPLLGVALAVVIVFWLAGRWIAKRSPLLERFGLGELSTLLLQRLLRLGFLIVGLIIALEILDATALAGAFLGVAGVVGIAFGFAFRNIVENYLAGILLSLRNPFATGDQIEVEGFEGKVIRLTSRDTVLMTLDGNHLRIPNRKVMDSILVNYSRNPLRRFDFAVGVSAEQDLVAVREFGLGTLDLIKGILKEPAPWVVVEELGDSTVNMRFFAWIDQTQSDHRKAKSEAIRLVKENFDEVGIEMPEPIYRVHLLEKAQLNSPTEIHKSSPPKRRNPHEADTSVDRTIETQIERVERSATEEDLLSNS